MVWELRSHMPQGNWAHGPKQKVLNDATKTPCIAAKTWHSQINKWVNIKKKTANFFWNSSCLSFLDLTLIATSLLLHPHYLFRILSLPGEILTTWNRSVGESTPDIKLIRKRWGGILHMLFITYEGKIKMLIIFIYALHIFQVDLGLWFLVYKVSFSDTYSFSPYLIL